MFFFFRTQQFTTVIACSLYLEWKQKWISENNMHFFFFFFCSLLLFSLFAAQLANGKHISKRTAMQNGWRGERDTKRKEKSKEKTINYINYWSKNILIKRTKEKKNNFFSDFLTSSNGCNTVYISFYFPLLLWSNIKDKWFTYGTAI